MLIKLDERAERLRKRINEFTAVRDSAKKEGADWLGWIETTDKRPTPKAVKVSSFAAWSKESLQALSDIAFHVWGIAVEDNAKRQKDCILRFSDKVSQQIHLFPVGVSETFLYEPKAEDHLRLKVNKQGAIQKGARFQSGPFESTDPPSFFWHEAVSFGRAIYKAPGRLKLCRYCGFLMWDSTKPCNRDVCESEKCRKDFAAARSRKSYKHRKTVASKTRINRGK
jgi:hypothetical protein